jgi:peptidoglycan/xylan/chitin deacetylase (PgdA/CDA1 family)
MKCICHSSKDVCGSIMPRWKQMLLSLYVCGTAPVRDCNRRRWSAQGRAPLAVFYWHRIADDGATPWTTSTATFARQVRWLHDRFLLVSLAEAQRRIVHGENRRTCITITFDDGYADNYRYAVPLLIREGIPFTYFVTAGNVLQGEPFAHDVRLGHRFAPNTLTQLYKMAAAGADIGCHTFSHARLSTISDPVALYREVVAARDELQNALGQPIRYFAFPYGLYGDLSPAAFALAKTAGYHGVCSAYGGYNFPGDDPFHIQRIPAEGAMIQMKNWATIDPRKLRTRRFEYGGVDSGQWPVVSAQQPVEEPIPATK